MRALLLPCFSLAAVLGLGACANTPASGSKTPDTRLQQSLRVDVLDAHGKPINGLACRLNNEHGYVLAQSGASVWVQRSARDLSVDCDAPQGQLTQAQLRARPEAGSTAPAPGAGGTGSSTSVYGSVGLGSFGSRGGVGINIGFPIPIGTASNPVPTVQTGAWRYPEWVQLRQGRRLLFDAQGSSSAQPALGFEAVRTP